MKTDDDEPEATNNDKLVIQKNLKYLKSYRKIIKIKNQEVITNMRQVLQNTRKQKQQNQSHRH